MFTSLFSASKKVSSHVPQENEGRWRLPCASFCWSCVLSDSKSAFLALAHSFQDIEVLVTWSACHGLSQDQINIPASNHLSEFTSAFFHLLPTLLLWNTGSLDSYCSSTKQTKLESLTHFFRELTIIRGYNSSALWSNDPYASGFQFLGSVK